MNELYQEIARKLSEVERPRQQYSPALDPTTPEEMERWVASQQGQGSFQVGDWKSQLMSDLKTEFVPSVDDSPEQVLYKTLAAGLNLLGGKAAMRSAGGDFSSASGVLGANVFHGSPHKFDAFDASKIGTGEGAQAYGHGLYLADKPDVAKNYALTTRMIDDVEVPARGNLYKVDLPDEMIGKMLDWDKPLSQQPESVRKALAKLKIGDSDIDGFREAARTPEGVALLRSVGIRGVRYLDQGSRTAGKGTYNYVVFPGEEKALKILERK